MRTDPDDASHDLPGGLAGRAGQALEIRDVQVPDVLEPGALLVRTSAATICATDVHLAHGAVDSKDAGADLPLILGHGPPTRLALAKAWGATETIDVTTATDPQARIDRVRELTQGRGADVILEMSGMPATFGGGIAMLRRGGRDTIAWG